MVDFSIHIHITDGLLINSFIVLVDFLNVSFQLRGRKKVGSDESWLFEKWMAPVL